jgi:protein-tyrosine phosphatase
MYLSFSMIPGRKSVMSSNSTLSNYFDKSERATSSNGGHDDDDDERRNGETPPPSSTAGGSDKDLNKKKFLPQPTTSAGEIEEELQSELLRCVTEQMASCNLSRLQIQRIPQEIRCFSWLRELLLGDNNISILPDTIFLQMQSLEVLDLMENKLVTVPRSIFQLRSLRRVLLDHNKIANLPDDIDPDPVERFGLPELIEVGLEWNALQEFPVNFLIYAPKLERMFLSENPGIAALPRPAIIEERRRKIQIRLDNRPMLLQAAQSNSVYFPSAGKVSLEWNKIYPDRVLDFLYLGSMRTAQCVEVYQDLDIGYVLTAARNLDVVLGPGMKHLTLPFDDLPGEDISHFFETSFKFINEAVANKKGILIHCFAGLSRSVAMTMGYLMKKYRITADDALALVRQSRPPAHPNDGFVMRLREYSNELGIDAEESKKVKAELEKINYKNITTAGTAPTSSAH